MTTTDIDLEALRRDLQYVKDKIEIRDLIHTQARGHDRHDVSLMTSVYTDDGVDEHGPTVKAAADYGDWANAAHSAASTSTRTTSRHTAARSTATSRTAKATSSCRRAGATRSS